MSNLPDPNNPPPPPPTKEQEPQSAPEAPVLREVAPDVELPKEVAGAGVKISPTTVSVPPPVAQLGVQAVGTQPKSASPAPRTVPLSDDQIAKGLHASITSSLRWLAEWCVRKLKGAASHA